MSKGANGLRSRREAGYAALMAVFLVATLLVIVTLSTPSVLIEGRRQREQEAVWRGNQYVRAIRLYYQKNGRFPQTLEDLTKASPSGAHFLRKAYTDPMNREDGTWRAIYVSPSGQLIGSVHYHTLQEMAAAKGFAASPIPGPPTGASAQAGGLTVTPQPLSGQASAAPATAATTGLGSTSQQPSSGFGLSSMSSLQPTAPVPLEAVDGPVLGGSVIGVGGKIKSPSLLVVDGGATYFQWEFIYNPLMSANGQAGGASPFVVQPGAAAPAPAGGPAQPGTIAPPGTSANPQPNGPGQIPPGVPLTTPPPGTDVPPPAPGQ